MRRVKKASIIVAAVAVALLFVGVERAWFAAEPAWRGKTVTEWLDHLELYRTTNGDVWINLRSPEDLARDPALAAILKIGAKATPILVKRLQERADWDPADGLVRRTRLWMGWGWARLHHIAASPPAPEGWSRFQRARKDAAAFGLLALGKDANAGFACLMEAYAAAPKSQSVLGTQIPGPPVGTIPSLVTRLARQTLPERDEEMIRDVVRGLQHTNACCREVAAECVWEFPEHLSRTKSLLFRLVQDENEIVREAALGQLLLIVQRRELHEIVPPAEVAAAATAVLDDPRASGRLKGLAETVLRLAADARAKDRPLSLAQPDGAANGKQPIRSDTNQSSGAAASRR
ncbi:MAG: hypothetical protein ACLQU3_12265 [Limisphaerales bacterium]